MSRYENIAGMLEDIKNLACVLREVSRIEKMMGGLKILPPPIRHSESRYIYPTFKEFLRIKRFSNISNPESLDYLSEIFSTGDSVWYFTVPDGSEVGPFGSSSEAEKQLKEIMANEGYRFLDAVPWTDKDCAMFPL